MEVNEQLAGEKISNIRSIAWSLMSSDIKFQISVVVSVVWWGLLIFFGAPISILYVFPVVLFIWYYKNFFSKVEKVFFEQFAKAKGYAFYEFAIGDLLESSAFKRGHSHIMRNVIQGNFAEHTFQLFTYEYTVGHGKGKHTFTSTIFELDFAKPMPHIVLLSKKQTGSFMGGKFPVLYEGKDLLHVEGDFHKYFDLYVTPELEIEALEIFTPDFMTELIDRAPQYSFEFTDDKIYIFYGSTVTTQVELDKMYELAKRMSERMATFLLHKKDTWFAYIKTPNR